MCSKNQNSWSLKKCFHVLFHVIITNEVPVSIIAKRTHVFALRFAMSQAGIAARTLILMQGSEEKERSANQTRARDLADAHANHTEATLFISQKCNI